MHGLFLIERHLGSDGHHRSKSLLFKINRFLVLQLKINKPTHSKKEKEKRTHARKHKLLWLMIETDNFLHIICYLHIFRIQYRSFSYQTQDMIDIYVYIYD